MISINGHVKLSTFQSPIKYKLDIKKGDRCLIFGRNGSGKTTFFDLLTGNLKLNDGTLKINSTLPIAYALQDTDNCLLPWLTIFDNITLPQTISDEVKLSPDYVNKYLSKFELGNRQSDYPYKLSGGEKQIVNFIRTILSPSEIFLFDEPFSSLHGDNKQIAKKLLNDLPKEMTIIIITHDINDLDIPHNKTFSFIKDTLTEIDDNLVAQTLNNNESH